MLHSIWSSSDGSREGRRVSRVRRDGSQGTVGSREGAAPIGVRAPMTMSSSLPPRENDDGEALRDLAGGGARNKACERRKSLVPATVTGCLRGAAWAIPRPGPLGPSGARGSLDRPAAEGKESLPLPFDLPAAGGEVALPLPLVGLSR